ncbi:DUF3253 domain-containing protein [Kordiimonas pumila]|uniref:DUF3253 domain-containing protein n=1 Tax=Kordiimonas pumila TaxID=2161677 RepID=A0ABV7D5X3_9PROT|nr:DUF3253 domain-containing protein [Kordiimonas pumila]
MAISSQAIRDEIIAQIEKNKSVAPRDIAQALVQDGEWQKILPYIKQEALALHKAGQLDFIRKKKIVSPEGLKGVYRFAKPVACESV